MSLIDVTIALLTGGILLVFYLIYRRVSTEWVWLVVLYIPRIYLLSLSFRLTTHRLCYAPYQLFKSVGIKGPKPTPFLGNYNDLKNMVHEDSYRPTY